ncbi:MAG: hypothetical protein US49_C0001G0143 [candidate division TM6 bacterium GW2011_GWF2_37_49]|nr:MAG: hypothetical protein US49_C0001G0143 [candidate division TM6 bacterium GW2011_GWF2_37_49]
MGFTMIIKFNLSQLESVVKEHILPLLSAHSIFTFTGPLGAGKTTMIKVILRQCGITQPVTSPTFGYVNSYQASTDRTFNHFDLYRISSIDEFVAAGFDEYLHRLNDVNFIEWPQVIDELLKSSEIKSKLVHIKISYAGDKFDARLLEIS